MSNKKKNKISIITSSLGGGGAEKIAVNLANFFANNGYEIELVTFSYKGEYIEFVSPLVKLIELNFKPIRFVFLRRYLKYSKPDMILSVARSTNIVVGMSLILNSKYNVVYREANTMHTTLNKAWLKRNIEIFKMKISYLYAKKIIANSNDTKEDLLANKITSAEKIKVIANPVLPYNFLELSEEKIYHEYFDDDSIKLILNVGRLVYQKNQDLLIRSFKIVNDKIPNTRLLIIGEGKCKFILQEKIKKLGLSDVATILNFKKNIFPYYKKANIFVLSSRWEGFGNVIVEGIALGKSIVSTNCPGGPKSILENGKYGKLVKLDNEVEMANAIIQSLQNPIDPNIMIKHAQKFTVENIAEKYLEVMSNE